MRLPPYNHLHQWPIREYGNDGRRERGAGLKRDLLFEQILDQVKANNELVRGVPTLVDDVAVIKEDVRDMKGRLILFEDIVRGNSADLRELKTDMATVKADRLSR